MNSYSISDLEEYSGIKAHTIRVWEHRYKALTPNRSDGNTRYYNNEQLRRLLNIVSLMDSDYKTSELCTMSDSSLNELLDKKLSLSISANNAYEYFISQILASGIEFDEAHFEKLFSNCILRFGLKRTYLNVIYPLLIRAGLLWAKNSLSVGSEHFISNLIRQKILSAIDSLPPAKSHQNSWLLFLPVNEFHEIGLLFSYYMIRQAGKKVIYLGANVPFDSLKSIVSETKPSNLFFFFVHYNRPEESQNYLNQLVKNFKNSKIYVSGNQKLISQLKTGKRINWIQSVEQFEKQLV
ncbi:MAG: MerR family transcriptional regulator [Bacteroidia bacterium]